MDGAGEPRAALDAQLMAAEAGHPGAHRDQASGQVGDLGLARGIADRRRAVGQHGRQQQVLGGADRRQRQQDVGAAQAGGRRRLDHAAVRASPSRPWRAGRPDESRCRAARWRRRRAAAAAPRRSAPAARRAAAPRRACASPDRRRCRAGSMRSAEIVTDSPAAVDDQCISQPRRCSNVDQTATSRLAGTLCRVTRWGVSSADTISGSTAFFAPLIG